MQREKAAIKLLLQIVLYSSGFILAYYIVKPDINSPADTLKWLGASIVIILALFFGLYSLLGMDKHKG